MTEIYVSLPEKISLSYQHGRGELGMDIRALIEPLASNASQKKYLWLLELRPQKTEDTRTLSGECSLIEPLSGLQLTR